ncbi:MAG: hypothetical protein ACTH2Y_08735 [Corynebacterium sp.]|uniref:hypothetical protein n=1 Tax=unclassified Corynebacterium TaxID=2624378 RepID=UPI002647C5A8|nr:hypothetical protein [Corynebacterium sp.]MDN5582787.1 hypothetical protein [Corynebacterium sp.]MDN5719809.1 hypothetical protein [Corynebacterium sp.]MDN6386958.1 hypothetical protein [Corynebacterium sp.]MDN6510641.1 hypothetical protein [Corynebacterium sp.]
MTPGGRQSPWIIVGIIAGVVGILVLVAALVLALTLWSARSGEDATAADDAALELTSVQRSPESEQASETSSPDATQDTETVTVTAGQAETRTQPESPSESEPEPQPEPQSEPDDGLACDGRGVLIVSSVMGNSPTFRSEVDGAVAANPGAVLLEPGHCPSLRPGVDGTTVHPVVVDYGDDREALCAAAAATPGSNARLLDGDTSYSSPC